MQLPVPTRELPVRNFEIFPQPAKVVEPVVKESARETIIALGPLAALLDVGSAGYEIGNVTKRADFCLFGGHRSYRGSARENLSPVSSTCQDGVSYEEAEHERQQP